MRTGGKNVETWPIETDLYITEPRRFFWKSFDTGWTVRVKVNGAQKVVAHEIESGPVNGP
ncbi:MAG: hypothetical protein ACR2IV_19105 [Bryobacteraceae bacterium]